MSFRSHKGDPIFVRNARFKNSIGPRRSPLCPLRILQSRKHAEQISELQASVPAALGGVAQVCAANVQELQALRAALVAGPEQVLAFVDTAAPDAAPATDGLFGS